MIAVRNLKKYYTVYEKEPGFIGSLRAFVDRKPQIVRAVDDISFGLADGEMVGFLGPNGAGKTTTLKMLSGVLHPTSGFINVNTYRPAERRSAFLKTITLVMGQKQQLLWDLPALDCLRVNQAIYEIPDQVFEATLRDFSDVLDLGGILKRKVRQLSLGERMKCELAAALLHCPKVLFLDEPTIGLDVNMQMRIREFIAHYNRKYAATIILTSHYMADVVALCRRIIVIDKGKIIFDGDLSGLMNRVATSKVIRIELAHPVPAGQLEQYGEIKRQDGLQAELAVPRASTRLVASRLLEELPLTDLMIEDMPVEEVISLVFAQAPAPAAMVE